MKIIVFITFLGVGCFKATASTLDIARTTQNISVEAASIFGEMTTGLGGIEEGESRATSESEVQEEYQEIHDRKYRRHLNQEDRTESEKPIGFGGRGSTIPFRCSKCPEDLTFCCRTGCCAGMEFLTELPVLLITSLWIIFIAFIVGAIVFMCRTVKHAESNPQNRTSSQPGPVIYRIGEDRVKEKSTGSSSTCETAVPHDHYLTDDVFAVEDCPEEIVCGSTLQMSWCHEDHFTNEKNCTQGNYNVCNEYHDRRQYLLCY